MDLCGTAARSANHTHRGASRVLPIRQEGWAQELAIATVSILGLLFSIPTLSAGVDNAGGKRASEVGTMGPVPKAECGRSDRTESGLQGQTTLSERARLGARL